MITMVGQVVIFFTSLVVTVACVCVVALLIARMYRDCRPSQWHEFWYTAGVVMFFGAIAALCGFGAYTIAHASALELIEMVCHDG